jgi:hypothetical protein
MKFEVSTAVRMWVVEKTSTLNVEATRSSETLVITYKATRRHNAEDSNHNVSAISPDSGPFFRFREEVLSRLFCKSVPEFQLRFVFFLSFKSPLLSTPY